MMQIKVFSAPRLHEALAQVRQALGPDAVILDKLEERSASGESLWRVHAALDTEDVGVQAAPTTTSPAIEATMKRLERIAASLGDRDADQYRQVIVKPRVKDAFDHLLEIGVSPTNAFEMAEDYAKHSPVSMPTLHWADKIVPKKEKAVVVFSGASGAGKTLLTAKLATHYSLKGISIALMTTDADRMGGSDVLRAYAAVLGVPFSVIRHQDDVQEALAESKSAQLVLIDSEGWNLRHAAGLRKQMELWKTLNCTHRILVMPASMDEADGLEMLKQTSTMNMTQIAFSKLDETLSPGKIVNWAEASRMPMSYCSFGPEVPEQMGWLSPKALTAILVKHHRQHQDEREEEAIA